MGFITVLPSLNTSLPVEPIAIVDSTWNQLKALVIDSLRSGNSKRLYAQALDSFYRWYFAEHRPPFSKAVVQEYRTVLERRGYATSTTALSLSALRKLATEAADNGLLDPQLAAGISRIRSPRRLGCRVGNWLDPRQAANLIDAPPGNTLKGVRDRAIIAVAVGCGLRRSEIASLTIDHLQLRDQRWVIADLIGKSERIRTVPIPTWVKDRLDRWLDRASIQEGRLFRSMNKAGAIVGESMTSQAVYEVIKTYASQLELKIAPHDLRRTFAKLAHAGEARLEQIQYSLGHGSLITTERYLGLKQDLIEIGRAHV